MKILITGGSGFVGRNLVEYFSINRNYQVYSPNSKLLNLLDSVDTEKYLKKVKPDIVIHAAADVPTRHGDSNQLQILHNNLMMFFSLARCQGLYKRMFYFGSGAEYDAHHYKPKMNEKYFDAHVPVDPYGFSKYICALYAGKSDNIYNLRLFGCFGPGERWQVRFISQSICKAIYDMDIKIGQNVRFDYLYVKDLAPIIEKMLTRRLKHHHYNICTGRSVDLRTIAEEVVKISQKNLKIKIMKPGFKKEYSGNNNRLKGEIKNLQFTPMPVAISEMYDWYGKQLKLIDKKELTHAL